MGGMNIVWKIFYHIPLAREGRMADVAGITIKQISSGILLVYQNFFRFFIKTIGDYQMDMGYMLFIQFFF